MKNVLPFLLLLLATAARASEDVTAPTAVTTPAQATPAVPGAGDDIAAVNDFAELDLAALLDAKVETASRKSESISKAPAIIEVLTRKQMLDLGVHDLYTALTYLPGIEVVETYNGNYTVVMRGQMMEQYNIKVLMLINGHPSYEPVNSLFNLELVPFEAIERLEVIRGPGSVLYGNNAYLGVINIITTNPKDGSNESRARAEAGQFTTLAGGAGNTGRSGDLAWGVFAASTNQRGYPYRIRKDQNEWCVLDHARAYDCTRPGKYSTTYEYFNNYTNGYGDLQFHGLRLQVGGFTQHRQQYALFPRTDEHGDIEAEHAWADLSYTHAFETLTLAARVGYDWETRHQFTGIMLPTSSDPTELIGAGQIMRGDLTAGWSITDQLMLDAGLGFEQGAITEADFRFVGGSSLPVFARFDDRLPDQTIAGGYAQLTWRVLDSLSIVAGDRVSRFQSTQRKSIDQGEGVFSYEVADSEPTVNQSPRGGVVWSPREDTTLKLLYGEAFRVPNLWESNVEVRTWIGSVPLEPETVRTVELGVDNRSVEWLSLRANAFFSKLDNLIGRRPVVTAAELAENKTVYDNIQRRTNYGAEVGANAVVNAGLTLFANAGWHKVDVEYIDPRYEFQPVAANPVHREVSAAPLTANGGVSAEVVDGVWVRPNAQFVGARGYAKAYTLANAVVDWSPTAWATLSLVGNNLLDTHYEYPEFVLRRLETIPGGPGRAFYGRATLAF